MEAQCQFQYSNYEPTGNLRIINVIQIKDPFYFIASFGEANHFKNFQNLHSRLDKWSRVQLQKNSQNPQNQNYFLKQFVLMDATNQPDINRSWCRAQIVSIEVDHLKLFLIDQGVLKDCSEDKVLLQLPDFYFSIEPQAKKCRLLNAQPIVRYFLTGLSDLILYNSDIFLRSNQSSLIPCQTIGHRQE